MITLLVMLISLAGHLGPTHALSLARLPTTRLAAPPASSVARDDEDGVALDPTTRTELRGVARHLVGRTLDSLLTPADARTIVGELLFDRDAASTLFDEDARARYAKYFERAEARLREESERTPADLLGPEITARLLSAVGGGGYDARTVLAFLESDAINSLVTRLLYDAIFEFTLKADIIGNAIAKLPLLGPVRAQVLKESKRNMDRTLGPLLQNFLRQYTKVAVRQAVDFVASEENAASFGQANAKLLGYLLEKRTVAEWLPEEGATAELREEAWAYLAASGDEEVAEDRRKVVERGINWTYELVGDKCLTDVGVDVDAVLDASPTLEKSLGALWESCRDAADAR